ncbi:MAG: hypothetical protein QOD52_119 [Gaiellaceae bacterium]|jgi:hypothetical protein|nr:hypothetical protein [Gaiellaceae bacterium]
MPWGFVIPVAVGLGVGAVARRRRTPEKDARNERIRTSSEFKHGAGYQGVGVAICVVAIWVPKPAGWFLFGLGGLVAVVGMYVMISAFWHTR